MSSKIFFLLQYGRFYKTSRQVILKRDANTTAFSIAINVKPEFL